MRRKLGGVLVAVLIPVAMLVGALVLRPASPSAQVQGVIQQSTGSCPTDPGKVALYPGLMCLVLDTSTLYMFDGTTWRQFVILPAGASTLTIGPGSTFQGPTVTGGLTVSGGVEITGAGLIAPYLATTSGAPIAFSGDLILGVTNGPTIGPGFGGVTLRARRSTRIPGACQLWAVAGSATTETAIGPPIPGNC